MTNSIKEQQQISRLWNKLLHSTLKPLHVSRKWFPAHRARAHISSMVVSDKSQTEQTTQQWTDSTRNYETSLKPSIPKKENMTKNTHKGMRSVRCRLLSVGHTFWN